MTPETRSLINLNAKRASAKIKSIDDLADLLATVAQQYKNASGIVGAITGATPTKTDNVIHEILGLTLPALADSVKEIAGIVHTAKGAQTPEDKALYHVQAEGRIEDATAGLRQYLWTLYYKGQQQQ